MRSGLGLPAFAWLAMTLAAGAVAAVDEGARFPGNPPIARFVPDLDVYPQNFAIAQDAASLVYVANADGVLVFDGERWALVRLPNGDLARSLAFDGARRVYVGGYDVFGYLETDAAGRATFTDLTPRFRELLAGESFADIWDVLVAPEGVFFRGVRHLFHWEPRADAVRLWRRPERFGAIARHEGAVLAQFRGEGFRRFDGEDWAPVPGGEAFPELVFGLVPMPDGALLALARDGRWRALHAGRVRDVAVPDGFPKANAFHQGLALPDGTLAFAADEGTLHLWHPVARQWRRVPIGPASLSGLTLANDGGMLLSSNEAAYHVEWPTPWTALGGDDGMAGSVHATAHWGDRHFVLAATGAYEVRVGAAGAVSVAPTGWTEHEAWDLMPLSADAALFAESYALKLIEGRAIREISSRTTYPRLLRRSRFDGHAVLVGTELGLGVAVREARGWRMALDTPDNAAFRVTSLVETAPREIWLGSERHGLRRIRLAADYSRIEETTEFGAAEGLAFGRVTEAWIVMLDDGTLVASTRVGLFRWTGERFVPTQLDGLEAQRAPDECLRIARGSDGTYWAYGLRSLHRREPGEAWRREDVSSVLAGVIETLAFHRGDPVFAATSAVLRFDPAAARRALDRVGGAPVALRAVELVAPDGERRPLPLDAAATLAQGDFGVSFRFALPEYRRERGARYRVRLLGYEEQLTPWTRATGYTYSRLRPGEYRLEVLGRDSLGRESAIAPFVLNIEPPWYRAPWALALWAAAGGALLLALVLGGARYRTRLLAADKQRLEAMVAERTRALEDANRTLESMAHLDGLTGIANRRRLDEYLDQVWIHCGTRGRPLAVLAIDVDHFKAFNDRHGHLAGDSLLKRLAGILMRNLRRTEDLVARYGGEEFLAILPGAELEVARGVAETLRQKVETSSLGTTISIGVAAHVPRPGLSVKALIEAADAALYRAKAAGRNRVMLDRGPAG